MAGNNELVHLTQNSFDRILSRLEDIWAESGACPSFIGDMHRTLSIFNSENNNTDNSSNRWALLPGLCCQAAGGEQDWTEDLATAWYLFYIAAHLMDKLEDHDEIELLLGESETGILLNTVSGLYFSASLILNNLCINDVTKDVAAEIIGYIHNGFLKMCGGQHQDLVYDEPNLEQFWEIVSAKSGLFFSMACRVGARLATDDAIRLEGYGKFGHHIGMLIQVFDDLEDLRNFKRPRSLNQWLKLQRTVPFIYALDVLSPSMRDRLLQCLHDAYQLPEAAEEILHLINQSGAALYVNVEIARHQEEALAGLRQAAPLPQPAEKLVSLLDLLLTS